MSYLIKGGQLIDPASARSEPGDLLIVGETIAALGQVASPGDAEVIDARGLVVCPGLIDMHVHLREPGFEHKETIASGTAAAAAGGFAVVCAEPNTWPPVDTPQRVADALARARGAPARVLPKACLTLEQRGEQPSHATALKRAGAIALSDDGEPVLDEAVMRECLRRAARARLAVTPHCEESPRSRALRPFAPPYQAEPALVERDLRLASESGAQVHFSHVTMRRSLELIAQARQSGARVSAEATPHHCLLCADDARGENADFKVNPPLRSRHEAQALAAAVASGAIDVIASDHAPHAPDEKARGWEQGPFGAIGLETTLAVMLTAFVHAQTMPLMNLLAMMTCNPARILGLKSGRLRVSAPADVTLIDLNHQWRIDPREFRSKGRNCPFAGWRVRGRAMALFVGGRMVMREREILSTAGIA